MEKQKSQKEQMCLCDSYLDEADEEDVSPICCVLTFRNVPSLAESASVSAHVGKNVMGGEKFGRRFGTVPDCLPAALCCMNE